MITNKCKFADVNGDGTTDGNRSVADHYYTDFIDTDTDTTATNTTYGIVFSGT